MPYFVATVVPSTSGRRSRCTPCRETSAPCISDRDAILSISSRKTMPFCSAAASALVLTSSSLSRRAASSPVTSFVDVASDVADLGELAGLDLDERRVGEARQPSRDFGLAHAGGPDHQDVLRRDLVPQRLRHLLPAPAIAKRDRDRALSGFLADDVLVELGDDFLGGHVRRHGRLVFR